MAPSQLAHDVISIVKEIADLDWMVATWNESTMGSYQMESNDIDTDDRPMKRKKGERAELN